MHHISVIIKEEHHKPDTVCLRISRPDKAIIEIELSQYQRQILICDLAETVKLDMAHKDYEYHTSEDDEDLI